MRPSSEGALESALEMEPRSTHLALFQSLVNFWHFLGFRFATPQAGLLQLAAFSFSTIKYWSGFAGDF